MILRQEINSRPPAWFLREVILLSVFFPFLEYVLNTTLHFNGRTSNFDVDAPFPHSTSLWPRPSQPSHRQHISRIIHLSPVSRRRYSRSRGLSKNHALPRKKTQNQCMRRVFTVYFVFFLWANEWLSYLVEKNVDMWNICINNELLLQLLNWYEGWIILIIEQTWSERLFCCP